MKKKIVMLCAVMLIACVSVFAAKDAEKIEFVKANSPMMSDFEKIVTYNEMHKSAAGGFALNTLIGCGVGSYSQGDWVGGTIGLCGEVGGASLLAAGIVLMNTCTIEYNQALRDLDANYPEHQGGYNMQLFRIEDEHSANMIASYVLMGVGGATWAGFKIYEMIRPFKYANKFNQELKDAFGITQLAVVPTYTRDNQWGTTVAASFAF